MKSLRVVLAVPAGPDFDAALEKDGGPEAAWAAAGLDESAVERLAARPDRGDRPGPHATAVVIDVLRATSTLTTARVNGAREILPATTVAEAFALRERHPEALLCGERWGRLVPGFDLGNSPFEYTRERVAGRALIFASSNGSQALEFTSRARRRPIAAFLNASAAARAVAGDAEVWLVASGKIGRPSVEDVACAGWIARALVAAGSTAEGEEAEVALAVAPRDAAAARALVEGCTHATLLAPLGPSFAEDVRFCASLDLFGEVPEI